MSQLLQGLGSIFVIVLSIGLCVLFLGVSELLKPTPQRPELFWGRM